MHISLHEEEEERECFYKYVFINILIKRLFSETHRIGNCARSNYPIAIREGYISPGKERGSAGKMRSPLNEPSSQEFSTSILLLMIKFSQV